MAIKQVLNKVRSVKNIEVIIAVIICIVIVLLFASTFVRENTESNDTSFSSYVMGLEEKLQQVISAMNGVEKTEVAISFKSGTEKVYAFETIIKTSGGITTEETQIVTAQGQPVVLKELAPDILGVVVVAQGADDVAVRLRIVQAVVTLLGIDGSKVQVFS